MKMGEDLKLVKELRNKTGAGFLDCKEALSNNNGNIDKSDKNTSKLLKKAQGFDKETKSLIRTALQDSGDSDWERIGSFNDFA